MISRLSRAHAHQRRRRRADYLFLGAAGGLRYLEYTRTDTNRVLPDARDLGRRCRVRHQQLRRLGHLGQELVLGRDPRVSATFRERLPLRWWRMSGVRIGDEIQLTV